MLTNLNFLNPGSLWPPPGEKDRLKRYEINRMIFENKHDEVYAEQFKRIQRVIGNFQDVISYAVLANFQKLISLKTADLLLGEPPVIKCGDEGSKEQGTVDDIKEKSDLINTAYMAMIDVSRFGDGPLLVYKDIDTSKGKIDVTQPALWFPVVSPDNTKKFIYHVLAWTYEDGDKKCLKCRIHQVGKYEERTYLLKDGVIKQIIEQTENILTGLTDFAVIPIPNTITSDRVFGIDDYNDIDSLVSELEVRISQIAKVLDKHAEPSVEGPASSLTQDPSTGEWKLKMGNYFVRENNEDPETRYIVWDAQMEANFKYIERLINLLYTVSEMGSAIFGDINSKTGQVPSGSALRRLMISPLAKVNRIRMRLDPALKKAIKLCSQLGGKDIVNLSDKEVNITWKDGLPEDPKEQAEIMSTRTGSKPTISQYRAIQSQDNLSDEETNAEMDRIAEDEAKINPFGGQSNPFGANNGGDPNAE